MDPSGQQTNVDTCPHCGKDTVVFTTEKQSCDHCAETFEL